MTGTGAVDESPSGGWVPSASGLSQELELAHGSMLVTRDAAGCFASGHTRGWSAQPGPFATVEDAKAHLVGSYRAFLESELARLDRAEATS